nr:beta-galactosidase 3-like [Tanacetum cinerariifolium]
MNLAAPMGISSVDWIESSLVAQMNRPLTRYKAYFNAPQGGEPLAIGKGQEVEMQTELEAKNSKIMIIHYNWTYPSGTTTVVLINGIHTPKERNVRCFMKKFRDIDYLFKVIVDTVRMRLLGLNIKSTPSVLEASKEDLSSLRKAWVPFSIACRVGTLVRFVFDGWGGSNTSCSLFPFLWVFPLGFSLGKGWSEGFEVAFGWVSFFLFCFMYVALCIELMLAGLELVYGDGSMEVWLVPGFLDDSEYFLRGELKCKLQTGHLQTDVLLLIGLKNPENVKLCQSTSVKRSNPVPRGINWELGRSNAILHVNDSCKHQAMQRILLEYTHLGECNRICRHLLINANLHWLYKSHNYRAKSEINQKAHILELKRRNYEEHCFDIIYAVSIKEDTAYLCLKLHSASTKNDLYVTEKRALTTKFDFLERKRSQEGTDIANITRKQLQPDKHRHENGKNIKGLKKKSRLRAKIRARGACIEA